MKDTTRKLDAIRAACDDLARRLDALQEKPDTCFDLARCTLFLDHDQHVRGLCLLQSALAALSDWASKQAEPAVHRDQLSLWDVRPANPRRALSDAIESARSLLREVAV